MRAYVPHKYQGRLCSRPTTIPLHKAVPGNAGVRSTQITGSPLQSTDNDFSTKAVPGNACVRSTQITGSSLQSTDDNFSTQGGPWQCVRAFHTNNRVVSAVDRQRFLYTRRSLAMRACVPHDRRQFLYTRRSLAMRACVSHK